MQRLIIETESAANASFLASFLRSHSMVRSVSIETNDDLRNVAREPSEEYNWTNPSRPATGKEIDEMLDKCERQYAAGLGMPVEEARALTKKKIAEWRKKKEM